MKIEAGKYYRTRDGRKARVYVTDHPRKSYPFAGSVEGELLSWTTEGQFYQVGGPDYCDLVAEWIDKTELPLGVVLPSWANKAIAMDEDDIWFCYGHVPAQRLEEGRWVPVGGHCLRIPSDHAPKWQGDWKQSLVVFDTET